jgi:hypothetical protein
MPENTCGRIQLKPLSSEKNLDLVAHRVGHRDLKPLQGVAHNGIFQASLNAFFVTIENCFNRLIATVSNPT